MSVVVRINLTGSRYSSGARIPGFGKLFLEDGKEIYFPEEKAVMNEMLTYADSLGHDTVRMRERLDEWVKTGKMPER